VVPVVLVGAIVLLAAITTAWILLTRGKSPSQSAEMISVQGTLSLLDNSGVRPLDGQACEGMGEYAAIKEGGPITVTDANGEFVAEGRIGRGVLDGGEGFHTCALPFAVNVPAGHGSYEVEVAGYGSTSIDEADLHRPMDLMIGQDAILPG
jgi:hypothetical protein